MVNTGINSLTNTLFKREKKVVCLGGGVGTVNLLRGLKKYTKNITTIISMADNGGSAGRLRRLYNIIPVGDLVSCMSAMSRDSKTIPNLLTYRFNGERYGRDHELGGHKLGNLIMVALKDLCGSYEEAIVLFKKLFHVEGNFLPATQDHVDISALTTEGKEIFGEEKIDLGSYRGKRILDKVMLHPEDAKAAKGVVDAILGAHIVVLGPGDLYTNLLPVLIVKDIAAALKKTKAKKIFVINVANKPFETRGYKVEDFIAAVKRHIGDFPFDITFVNNNFSIDIPKKFHYKYVKLDKTDIKEQTEIVQCDLIDKTFPLYHSPEKLAKAVWERV